MNKNHIKPKPLSPDQVATGSTRWRHTWQYQEMLKGREFYGEPRNDDAIHALQAKVAVNQMGNVALQQIIDEQPALELTA